MNVVDVALVAVLAAVIGWAVLRMVRTRKSGGCGCGCAGCQAKCNQREP